MGSVPSACRAAATTQSGEPTPGVGGDTALAPGRSPCAGVRAGALTGLPAALLGSGPHSLPSAGQPAPPHPVETRPCHSSAPAPNEGLAIPQSAAGVPHQPKPPSPAVD